MAENSGGYIGNKPSDSSVTIARQAYTSTGITTDFTFRSGYTPGYLDAYLNGVRLIETDDYVATDGTTLSLSTAAQDGDTLELIAYKAFNVSEFTLETELGGNFNVSNDLTVGGNINLEGNLDLQDGDKILLGTGDDLQIYHDGETSFIEDAGAGNLHLKTNGSEIRIEGSSASLARFFNGASVELHHNGSKKIETTSSGINITGTTDTDQLIVSGVSTFSGNLNVGTGATVGFGTTAYFKDNAKAIFGDGEDLQIYHDGSISYISDQGTGALRILSNQIRIRNAADTEEIATFDENSSVDLYYDNEKKFETTSTGSLVTGILTATDFSGASGGAADFPNGLTGTTGTFSGNVSAVDGTFTGNVSIAGTLTYEDVTNIDSIGIVTARNGLHVTGGSVGIGTDTPTSALEIRTTTTNAATHYRNNASNGGAYFGVRATDLGAASAGQAYIYSYNTGINLLADGTGYIDFATGGTASKVRITSNGNVGIGTNIPETKLHVSDGHTASANDFDSNIVLAVTKNTTVDSFAGIAINSGKNAGSFIHFGDTDDSNVGRLDYSHSDNAFKFFTNGSSDQRLGITSDGKIGINQTSPSEKLEVYAGDILLSSNASGVSGGVGPNAALKFEYNGHQYAKIVGNGRDGSGYGDIDFYTSTSAGVTNLTQRMTIRADGKIGIGTITPNSILHTESPAATAGWQVRTNSEGLNNESGFYRDVDDDYECVLRNADGGLGFIKNNGGSSDPNLHFHVGTTEKVRITHDGKVGINTQNPQAALDVAGTITQNVVEYPSIRPALDFNFAATKTLDRRITFTRDSVGTYYDELGNVKYASNNTPRFDHDPDTGESLGLLIEESRTNLVSYSYYQGNGSIQTSGTINNWGLLYTSGGTASLTPGIDAPDGSNNAVRFTNLNTGDSILRINIDAFTPNGSDTYTLSFWARAVSGTGGMSCDLADGAPNGTWTDQLVTNKWVRVVKSGVPSNASKTFIDIISNVNNNRVVDFWGLQLEKGPFITSYIPTSGSTVTREPDHAYIRDVRVFDFFNETEGTVLFEHTDVPQTTVARYPGIGFSRTNTVTSTRAIHVFFATNNQNVYYLVRGSGSIPAGDVATIGASSGFELAGRIAFVYKANDFVLARNGTIVGTDTSGALPDDCFGLALGNNGFSDYQFLNAHIKRFSYYPKRLPNAQLQGLTYQ